jgi:4-oxalocrotonate tautomerase
MPVVEIKLFEGRSVEIKKRIAKEVTEVLVKHLQIPEDAVIVIFEDIKRENFAQAGELAVEVTSS